MESISRVDVSNGLNLQGVIRHVETVLTYFGDLNIAR